MIGGVRLLALLINFLTQIARTFCYVNCEKASEQMRRLPSIAAGRNFEAQRRRRRLVTAMTPFSRRFDLDARAHGHK